MVDVEMGRLHPGRHVGDRGPHDGGPRGAWRRRGKWRSRLRSAASSSRRIRSGTCRIRIRMHQLSTLEIALDHALGLDRCPTSTAAYNFDRMLVAQPLEQAARDHVAADPLISRYRFIEESSGRLAATTMAAAAQGRRSRRSRRSGRAGPPIPSNNGRATCAGTGPASSGTSSTASLASTGSSGGRPDSIPRASSSSRSSPRTPRT